MIFKDKINIKILLLSAFLLIFCVGLYVFYKEATSEPYGIDTTEQIKFNYDKPTTINIAVNELTMINVRGKKLSDGNLLYVEKDDSKIDIPIIHGDHFLHVKPKTKIGETIDITLFCKSSSFDKKY